MKSWLWKVFNIVAGCASIIGVLYLFFSDKENGIIALFAFCSFLLFVIAATWMGIIKLIKKENPEEYKKITVFTSYETTDGIHGVYEVFKVIQSKRLILQQIEHNFKWTGSKRPAVSSELQDLKQLIEADANDYDKAILVLRRPLGFNETGTIHFKAMTDDFDGKAQPHLDFKVNTAINIIHFRVTLKHKEDYSQPAKLLRKPIDSRVPADYEQYGSVPFDKMSKSYQYYLTNPEIGYFYRLEWAK